MRFKKLLSICIAICGFIGFSQQLELSALAKVSVLTIGPGDELNSKFGHSAIKVQDPTIGMDIVYNYGMFDFNEPNFYTNFARGKLNYWIDKETKQRFLYGYAYEKRWVKEQILNLSAAETKQLYQFLETNYLPENRYYKYDFFFDNCTTRLPEALQAVLGDKLQLAEIAIADETTFRDLIHQNLELNSWSNFGIDLALGSVIDKKGTPFLPVNLLTQLRDSKINGKNLVYREVDLLPEARVQKSTSFYKTPIFCFSLLVLIVLLVTIFDSKKNKRSRWLDFLLFLLTGAAGTLILLLWFATDHQATKLNYNVLWAVAPNLLIAFVVLKKTLPKWLKIYLILLVVLIISTILLWVIKIQIFSPLLLFILASLNIRYLFLISSFKKDPQIT